MAETLTGKVVGIADGDTLTLLTDDKRQVKIRLAEIDTPEKRQPYGKKAKQKLSELVFSKQIRVSVKDVDRYGRTIGRVYVGDLDVNAELVKQGAAWVYRKYSHDKNLFDLEAKAKEQNIGLWNMPEAYIVPPWEWRKGKRKNLPSSEQSKIFSKTCGSKRYCKQMVNCEEARFYLTQCGLTRLDGNKDGVPCEKLCN
ncbi:MAG: nuclease [Methylomarinum sp.]|nr:nuclease [Methylomarinum sp.]